MPLGKKNITYTYKMGLDTNLAETSVEKDVGVYADNDLSFNFHIQQRIMKTNKSLVLRRAYKCLDSECMKLLYKALVRHHLEYGHIIWSPSLPGHIT